MALNPDFVCYDPEGPGPYADQFQNLEPGDEVVLVSAKKTVVIASVAGCSALATDGTKLDCRTQIQKTGEHYPDFEKRLSSKAKKILSELDLY